MTKEASVAMSSLGVGPPAALGGEPAFPEPLGLVRPALPNADALAGDVRAILARRVLTNGPTVAELERRAADYLGVRHCVAVGSCTAGLMLVLRAAGLEGEVVVPSFTFVATAHAVAWNGLRPVFADVDPDTLTVDPSDAGAAAGPAASAIVATHVYGTPCAVESLARVAEERGLALFYDAAHAFGSRRGQVPVGRFGAAEVFSLSPTKVLVAAEGGFVSTDDDELAERCRIGRDYANPGDYDARFVGLNARMSELHAALALRSLEGLDERIERRNGLAAAYRGALEDVPGVDHPAVSDGDRSTFKDLTVMVDPEGFGLDAAALGQALKAEGVDTRRYYAPPVHRQQAYRHAATRDLPVTDRAAARVLTLPLWSEMTESQVGRVGEAVRRIQRHAGRVADQVAGGRVDAG